LRITQLGAVPWTIANTKATALAVFAIEGSDTVRVDKEISAGIQISASISIPSFPLNSRPID